MKSFLPVHAITAMPLLSALVALLIGALPSAIAGPFLPGEILVNEINGNSIQRYSAGGTLLQTITGTNTFWEGAALTPDGNLVTNFGTPSQGINIFNPNGTLITSFPVTTSGKGSADVSVFPNGTLALCDSNNNGVQFRSQTGTLLNTVFVGSSVGSTVGSDGILYVTSRVGGALFRISAGGVSLGTVSLSFVAGDLVMNPADGTLWVAGKNDLLVHHIQTDGTVLGSFATGLSGTFLGIGLAPDDNSLYVTATSSTDVKHFDLSGNLLDSFALTSPNTVGYITVVPTPEPGSATLLLGGLTIIAARRRRIG